MRRIMAQTPQGALKVPRAFRVLVGHLPSAILSLPAFVSRSPPDNSCIYPSWISRSLCSAGIVRCIKPLAQSRNETNSSWVNGADKSGFIFQICASGAAVQASHPATIKLIHYRRLGAKPHESSASDGYLGIQCLQRFQSLDATRNWDYRNPVQRTAPPPVLRLWNVQRMAVPISPRFRNSAAHGAMDDLHRVGAAQ